MVIAPLFFALVCTLARRSPAQSVGPPIEPGTYPTWGTRSSSPSSSETVRIDSPRPFVLVGIALWDSPSLVNAWLLGGRSYVAGAEIPTRWSWTFVPRVHAEFDSAPAAGRVRWVRLAADARGTWRERRGGQRYVELGGGLGYLDARLEGSADVGRLEPFGQAVLGMRVTPFDRPALVIESVVAACGGSTHSASLELMIGVEF